MMPEGRAEAIERLENDVAATNAKASARAAKDLPAPKLGDTRRHVAYSLAADAAELRRALRLTKIAASTEETRYYLNGVFFDLGDDVLKLVATDGHRLVASPIKSAPVVGKAPFHGVILCRKQIAAAIRALPKKGPVAITLRQWQVWGANVWSWASAIRLGETELGTVEGTFPDWRRVIGVPQMQDSIAFEAGALAYNLECLWARRGKDDKGKQHRRQIVKLSMIPAVDVIRADAKSIKDYRLRGTIYEKDWTANVDNWRFTAKLNGKKSVSVTFDAAYLRELTKHATKTVKLAPISTRGSFENPWHVICDNREDVIVVMPCKW